MRYVDACCAGGCILAYSGSCGYAGDSSLSEKLSVSYEDKCVCVCVYL